MGKTKLQRKLLQYPQQFGFSHEMCLEPATSVQRELIQIYFKNIVLILHLSICSAAAAELVSE